MNKNTVKVESTFRVGYTQYLDEKGKLSEPFKYFSAAGVSNELLVEFYRWMLFTRTFDCKAIALQRTGRLGTYASCLGQEAVGAAIGKAMRAEDVFIQAYRETAAVLIRGVTPEEILMYWGGDERGMDFKGPREDMPCTIPIASQCCHAVGISYAMKLRKEPRVAVVVCGDGATSKGDFYESVNAAGVWQLPLVFIINNNQWAISLPRDEQSSCETLAQKAIAGGISCEQVDGNDVIACYIKIKAAIDRAREGQGPHLIETISYRLSDHTTADDASRYRDEDNVGEAWQKEPMTRLRNLLMDELIIDNAAITLLEKECSEEIDAAVTRYLAIPPASPTTMFEYLYETLPDQYLDQLEQVRNTVSQEGEK
ncbi:pyruvate dehydrogenase (acetyl-transferring) E1 component subunit alpha [Moritella sp.]|uniref:pyruvate dehydrogenase (acetyl-transferring) E1 component subunit alpha n=1 Tax=Moritella sp. TaxID=78556 RepID=UPI001D59CA23|nr:pyruvate dehydrogenase (acetyl-transferring) E1 component subunit alpha [Moritella sp.]MCJ8351399.1 pyruvate dehydrogenase (acetyl-transferring) E1 component subunit alpha [Moritella sp.]NQZ40221.1 pyruvate dehydrogenase (acetyl-transferring) E1 component subunit alpha [Moritella sp.]